MSNEPIAMLAPVISCRFCVEFPSLPNAELVRQLTKVNIDFVNKKIAIQLRQPAVDAGFLQTVMSLCNDKNYIVVINHLDCDGKTVSAFTLSGCNTVSHAYLLDYASTDPATHNLEIAFNEVLSTK